MKMICLITDMPGCWGARCSRTARRGLSRTRNLPLCYCHELGPFGTLTDFISLMIVVTMNEVEQSA